MSKLDDTQQMLKELTDANGIPGNERQSREVMKKYIEPFADSIETDNLGSLIAKKEGLADGPKIMVAGHLDEVGLMVSQIDDIETVVTATEKEALIQSGAAHYSEILAPEEGITVGRQHLDLVFAINVCNLDYGNVESTTTEVIHSQLAVAFLLVHAECKCCSGWLIDNT